MGSEEICTEGAEETCILQKQLEEYVSQGLYPLHMPGHKRRVQPAPGLPYDWEYKISIKGKNIRSCLSTLSGIYSNIWE